MLNMNDGGKSINDTLIDVVAAGVCGGATGYAGATAGAAAAGATGSLIAASGLGAAVGGSALGTACVTAAPLVVGFVASCWVASKVFDFLNEMFD